MDKEEQKKYEVTVDKRVLDLLPLVKQLAESVNKENNLIVRRYILGELIYQLGKNIDLNDMDFYHILAYCEMDLADKMYNPKTRRP